MFCSEINRILCLFTFCFAIQKQFGHVSAKSLIALHCSWKSLYAYLMWQIFWRCTCINSASHTGNCDSIHNLQINCNVFYGHCLYLHQCSSKHDLHCSLQPMSLPSPMFPQRLFAMFSTLRLMCLPSPMFLKRWIVMLPTAHVFTITANSCIVCIHIIYATLSMIYHPYMTFWSAKLIKKKERIIGLQDLGLY